MKKIIALCLILIVLSTSILTSCSINNYKPISIKHQNSDYAAYDDGEHRSFLIDLLNNSKWHYDVAKCDCDYTVIMKNNREIFYHSECGTFVDYDFNKSLTVSEEDRVKLNDYFADAMCRSNVHFFDENHRCTACGYNMSEHDHTSEMRSNEYAHWYVNTCGCETPENSAKHGDIDGDFLCDDCGYDMNEHEHTYAYNHDDIGHGWSYTCGCMTPPNFAPHFDGDGDGKCDEESCGYEYAECDHQWDDGVEIEGGLGGYVMEYTCTLCGDKKRETITIIPPSGVSHSISYQSDRTKELLMDGFAPTSAKPGDTVVLRTDPLMDADLAFYANGVKLTQTYADSDYWEYVFTMPDEDVVITHEITDGFLPD